MDIMWQTVRSDISAGLRTSLAAVPRRHVWMPVAYAAFALVVGISSGLLRFDSPSPFELIVLPWLLLAYPALIEEVVFRGALLPRSLMQQSKVRRFIAVTLSTGLFVLMHPVNAWLIGLSDTSQFLEPSFLVIVTALGYTCGYLYLRCGSLWAPIAVHWLTVVAWNLFLGRDLSL